MIDFPPGEEVGLTREIDGLDDGVTYSVTMQARASTAAFILYSLRAQAHNVCGWNDPCRPCLMLTDDAEPQPPVNLGALPLSHSCISLSWLPWNPAKKFTRHELVVSLPHVHGGGG